MVETIEEMTRRHPDRILRLMSGTMKQEVWKAEEMEEAGVEEVIPDLVMTREKLEGLDKLIKDWERINKKGEIMLKEVI